MDDVQVDVHYRGTPVVRGADLQQVGPTTAFISVATPMPVGTKLSLVCRAGEVNVTVVRVQEAVGEELPGIRVRRGEHEDDPLDAWWRALVSKEDWVASVPSYDSTPSVGQESATQSVPVPDDVVPSESTGQETATVASSVDAAGGTKRKKRRTRRKRKTRS